MSVIFFSTDRNLCKEESPVLLRLKRYAEALGEDMHVILHAQKKHGCQPIEDKHLFVYPTNTRTKLGFFCRALRVFNSIQKKGAIRAIAAQDPFETGMVGLLAARKRKIPLLIQVHADIGSPFFAPSFFGKIRLAVGFLVIKKANLVRVVSRRIKSFLQEKGVSEDQLLVLPLIGEVPQGSVPEPEGVPALMEPVFLIASRFSAEKNISMAVKAFAELRKTYARGSLLLVGEGTCCAEYQELIDGLQMEKHVTILPWQDSIFPMLSITDVFLLSSDYEGYGRTLVEAAGCGVPIITTDVGCARDVVEDGQNGRIVDPGNAVDWQRAMEEAFDEKKRSAWKERAQMQKEHVLVSQDPKKYTEAFREMIQRLTQGV